MKDKQYFPESDETKYKKKSSNKGMKRSDHKHQYEDVLLTNNYHHNDLLTGKPKVTQYQYVGSVCTICGYVGNGVKDRSKYYDKVKVDNLPNVYKEFLNEKAMKLPKWRKDFWGKFAVKDWERNNETDI